MPLRPKVDCSGLVHRFIFAAAHCFDVPRRWHWSHRGPTASGIWQPGGIWRSTTQSLHMGTLPAFFLGWGQRSTCRSLLVSNTWDPSMTSSIPTMADFSARRGWNWHMLSVTQVVMYSPRVGPQLTHMQTMYYHRPESYSRSFLKTNLFEMDEVRVCGYLSKVILWTKSHAWEVLIYAAGFPCTPFSSLHWQSLLLEEAAAKPMYRVLDNLAACAAPAPWLINDQNHEQAKNITIIKYQSKKTFLDPFGTAMFPNWKMPFKLWGWNAGECPRVQKGENRVWEAFGGEAAWAPWFRMIIVTCLLEMLDTSELHVPLVLRFRYKYAYLDLNACLGS